LKHLKKSHQISFFRNSRRNLHAKQAENKGTRVTRIFIETVFAGLNRLTGERLIENKGNRVTRIFIETCICFNVTVFAGLNRLTGERLIENKGNRVTWIFIETCICFNVTVFAGLNRLTDDRLLGRAGKPRATVLSLKMSFLSNTKLVEEEH
jgi:hypothetical protein